ncbi:MAG: hypothetical protein JXA89_07485 [Anaerolineae bacterium]|nr:hypothetical protein [Anaerolineae bacterium]
MQAMDYLVLVGLFCFAIAYNWLVAKLENDRRILGYVSLLVAGGCSVVLIGIRIRTDAQTFQIALECFVAAGLPMILGSIIRYQNDRKRVEDAVKETAKCFFASSGGQWQIKESSGEPSTSERSTA